MAAAMAQAAAPGLAAGGSPGPARAQCSSAPFDIGGDVDVVKAYRMFAGPDGASHVEDITLPGKRSSHYGGSVKVTLFDLGRPTHVSMVFGQPNMIIPAHPPPYREIFIIVAGSSQMVMPDGQVLNLVPGSLLIADDVGVTRGRGGSAGPCGYTAIDLACSSPPLPETGPSYDKK